ncbi:MAG: hypothetical protein ACHQ49_08165 [Elusimicrobiota bacterium]
MNDPRRFARDSALAAAMLGLCALEAPYAAVRFAAEARPALRTPEAVVESWPLLPRSAALMLISKYGEPTRFEDDSLIWEGNGPWKKTVVHRAAPRSFLGFRGKNILEQSISYAVPNDQLAALDSFEKNLRYDEKEGELSSTSESEKRNYLTLNLAAEIIAGKRTVDEARDFSMRMINLSEAGKAAPYMDGFVIPLRTEAP